MQSIFQCVSEDIICRKSAEIVGTCLLLRSIYSGQYYLKCFSVSLNDLLLRAGSDLILKGLLGPSVQSQNTYQSLYMTIACAIFVTYYYFILYVYSSSSELRSELCHFSLPLLIPLKVRRHSIISGF